MNVEEMLRRGLKDLNLNAEQIKSVCELFQKIEMLRAKERRVKQMIGIAAAREQGKTLGRPKIKEPDNFKQIVSAWEQKKLNAVEAAKLCGIGMSTFYRRVKELRVKGEHERK